MDDLVANTLRTAAGLGESDGEGTFAGVRDNDEVAPIPAVRMAAG